MLGWYTKAEQLIHCPHMVGQPSGHGWGHWLPLLPRPFLAFSREGVGQRVRLPTTQASTSLSAGLQAIQTQASPAMAASFSNGVRRASFLAMKVHSSSNWHSHTCRCRKKYLVT